MLLYNYYLRGPGNFLVVLSNQGSAILITKLKKRSLKMMLAQHEDANKILRLTADFTWY